MTKPFKEIINENKILKEHLEDLGFKFFDNLIEYNQWAKSFLFESKVPNIIKKNYLKYLNKNFDNVNYNLTTNFYNLIAKYDDLLKITHSLKSYDIFKSGTKVINELKNNSNILDIGCNIGYLTSFYSKLFSDSKIIGLDKSKYSIIKAHKIYNKDKYPNLNFMSDYSKLNNIKFDYIVDTQCLSTLNNGNLSKFLYLLKNKLKKNGRLISISSLPREKSAKLFIKCLNKNKFFIKSYSPLFIKNIFGIQVYTKIIIDNQNTGINFDINSYYNMLRKKISIVNLNNII